MLPCTTCSPPFLCISRLIHSDSDSDHLRLSPNFPTAERTTVIMPRDVKAYLASKKSETSDLELAQEWAEIEELYSKRLWHQLTGRLMCFVKHPSFQHGGLLELYHNFLSDFEHKINPLSLVEIILVITEQITEPDESVAFLESAREKVKNDVEAKVLCMTSIGVIKLKGGQLDIVKSIVEEAGELLDTVSGVTAVHSRYYDLCSHYHQLKADHAAYYRDALRYLGCVDIADIPMAEQVERAFHLALAALLGETVYNFGELLAHPVLDSLQGTDKEWIVNLLYAFNAGNLSKYKELQVFWEQQPDLASNYEKLLGKIQLLALMEVELLVMKALSLGLVKGSMDEVNQEVNITWVQPRVLGLNQVTNLKCRMDDWCKHIKKTVFLVKDEVPDVVA